MNKFKTTQEETTNNEQKSKKKSKSNKKRNGFRLAVKSLVDILNGNFLNRKNVVGNLSYLLFITAVMVCYIGYGYYTDGISREISETTKEIEELRSDYQTTKKDLNRQSLQSQVAVSVEDIGLKESIDPPKKIVVTNKDEY